MTRPRLLPEMAIVTLVSIYDAYIGKLVRGFFRTKPEVLNGSNRQLTFAQLAEFPTLDAARDHIVEAEVESLLRDGHSAQFEWFENRLGIPLRKDLPAWKTFVEVTERRNLFVHADGVIGSQYLAVCRKNGVVLEPDICVGKMLHVPPDYFRSACDCLTEIGVKLGQVIWRKIQPENIEAADNALIGITYDLLTLREYELAEILLVFATQPPIQHVSNEVSLIFKINLAIAYKWQDKVEECKQLLETVDWTALADKFQLAASVLRDEYDNAAKIMKTIGSLSRPTKAEYRDWPLFREFRKTDEFKKAYREVFGEAFRLVRSSEIHSGKQELETGRRASEG